MTTYFRLNKAFTFLFFHQLFLTSTFASASSINLKPGTITGIVYDQVLKEPLPYVTVLLVQNDGKTLSGTITVRTSWSFSLGKPYHSTWI